MGRRLFKVFLLFALVLLLLNIGFAIFFFNDLLKDVLKAQVFLIILFGSFTWLSTWLKKKMAGNNAMILLVVMSLKMLGALIYMLPVIFSESVSKETVILIFMVNYLIYLNFSVVTIVKSE